ncbi:MAG: hypothetical protein ACPGXZ_10655 [Saprospiraceae bacterium]
MADWNKLSKELDNTLKNMTKEDWQSWKRKHDNKVLKEEKEKIEAIFKNLVKVFPFANVEYEYKQLSNTHFFKISPDSIYNSVEFIDYTFDVVNNFNKNWFDSLICFITDNSLIELTNPSKKHYANK